MDKWLFLALLAIPLLFVGCVSSQAVCGNDVCESGENETACPNDCATTNANGQAQAAECDNLMQIEALKLKSAIEQAVNGEVAQLQINQPKCAGQKMAIKVLEDNTQCQETCQTLAARCLVVEYAQGKAVCIENTPTYAAFLTQSPCEAIANTSLTAFQNEIPNGKFILTNASTVDSQMPKICAYKNTGLSAAQIQETFVPAKMKWIAEEARKEALEKITQNLVSITDQWNNSPDNWVAIPSGSEGKPWKEILEDFTKVSMGGEHIVNYFWMHESYVQTGSVGNGYSVRPEATPNDQFGAAVKIVTKENCGPQNSEACRGYHIEYSFSNAEKGPKIVVVKNIESPQKIEYKTPLYSEPLKVYPTSDFVERLAELVAQSQ